MSKEAGVFWLVIGIILVAIAGYYLRIVQVYFVVLGFIALIAAVIFFIKYHNLWPKLIEERYKEIAKKPIKAEPGFPERWSSLRQAMKSNDLNELRVAIIDADTLMEEFLRSQGIEGDTMAALIAEASFRGITGTDTIAQFHRLRNRIVHESTFAPSPERLREALKNLDEVLVRWGVVLPLA